MRHNAGHSNLHTLGLAKRDLWGLGAESWIVVARYAFAKIGGSFWQKHNLLKQTMTLLQGPKDPVLPTLIDIPDGAWWCISSHCWSKDIHLPSHMAPSYDTRISNCISFNYQKLLENA